MAASLDDPVDGSGSNKLRRPVFARAATCRVEDVSCLAGEITTGSAAKLHHLVGEPIGFQAARGNTVDDSP